MPNYTVFPLADLEGYDDMTPTLGTCFANTTGLPINNTLFGCTQKNGECCYDAANVGDQVSRVAASPIPMHTLACKQPPLTCTVVSVLLHSFDVAEHGWWVL